MDGVVVALFDFADRRVFRAANPTTGERVALAATGGFGRGLLAPYSDIDLLALAPYMVEPNIKDGKGGLRDLQTLSWIASALYGVAHIPALVGLGLLLDEEAARFAKADAFLVKITPPRPHREKQTLKTFFQS